MLRGIFALVAVVVLTGVLGTYGLLVAPWFPRRPVIMRLGKLWSRLLLRTVGVEPVYAGLEHARGETSRVFISNHQSNVDIWAIAPALPDRTLFVAKHQLFRVPIMGWAMRTAGFISINRRKLTSAIESLDAAVRRIRGGRPVILFAEGTRSRDGRLAPFKKGAFHLALQAGVPVVPVAVSGSWNVIRPRTLRVRPGPVRVTFGEPIDVTPYLPDDLAGLMTAVRVAIARNLDPVELDPGDLALVTETR